MKDGMRVDMNGSKGWYVKGKLHREDGPAVEYANGTKAWRFKGMVHRTDGPAVMWADRDPEWYVNDKKCYTNEEFQQAAGLTDEELIEIILKYGPVNRRSPLWR